MNFPAESKAWRSNGQRCGKKTYAKIGGWRVNTSRFSECNRWYETMEEVVRVKVIRDYVLEVEFSDGKRGEIDLEAELHGEVFEPLTDPPVFKLVTVEGGTVAWPNGADFAPEFIYDRVTGGVKP